MTLFHMSFNAGTLILFVLMLRKYNLNKLPKNLFMWLWNIALIRLIIPFFLPLAGMGNFFQISKKGVRSLSEKVEFSEDIYNFVLRVSERNLSTTVAGASAGEFLFKSVLIMVWIVGMAICSIYFICAYRKEAKILQQSIPVSKVEAEFLRNVTDKKLKNPIYISDRIQSPVVFGIFKQRLILPKNFVRKILIQENEEILKFILCHECVHMRRHDNLKKLLCIGVVCLHWFNPLVWVMKFYYSRDIELACDEIVLKKFGENKRKFYANVLLNVMESTSIDFFVANSAFVTSEMRERMVAIMKYRKAKGSAFICAAVILTASLSVFAATEDGGEENAAIKETALSDTRIENRVEEICKEILSEYEDFPEYSIYCNKDFRSDYKENSVMIRCYELEDFRSKEGNSDVLIEISEEIMKAIEECEEVSFSWYEQAEDEEGYYGKNTAMLCGMKTTRDMLHLNE